MLSYQTKEWMRIRHMKPAFSTDKISERDLAQIKGMFQQLDEDGSGTIELAELKDAMKMLGMSQDAKSLIEQFKYIDSDGSGEIDFEEFAQMLSSTNSIYQCKLIYNLIELHRLCDEQKVTQWLSSLISFAESLRRYKLLSNISDKRVEDEYRFRMFCDIFAVPSYLKEMRADQEKLEQEKDRQMHQAGANYAKKLICHEPDFIKNITKCHDEVMEIEDIAKESLSKSRMKRLQLSRPQPPQSAPPTTRRRSGRNSPSKVYRKHLQPSPISITTTTITTTPTTTTTTTTTTPTHEANLIPSSVATTPKSPKYQRYSPIQSSSTSSRSSPFKRPVSELNKPIKPPPSPSSPTSPTSPPPPQQQQELKESNNNNNNESQTDLSLSQLTRYYRPNRCLLITSSARIPSPRRPFTRSYSPFPPLTTQPYTVNELKVTQKSRRARVCIPNLTTQKSPGYYQLHDSGAVTARV